MRLTVEQRRGIVDIVLAELGERAIVSLFGSRLDENRKGGDVDLLIESETEVSVLSKARLKMRLEALLNLPVDLVVIKAGQQLSAFKRLALRQGERL
ncbi:nucleotidyltransferase family protein [Methylotuvimicrobium sp. KM1]|uniref:nucleotidyltransferase family protein n=1 Tax=Methylotuvimicrobium sp. KM1 TaxID=3377707 RepID=UPI00384D8D1B